MQLITIITGVYGFLGVALGAFGAHYLKNKLSLEMLNAYQTGVLYHLLHTAVLLGVNAIAGQLKHPLWFTASWFFILGILLFSGSLYVLAFTQTRIFGAITPIGGLAFLTGWLLVIIAALKSTPIGSP